MKIIAEWFLRAIILVLVAYIVPGFVIDSFSTALIVAFVLAVLNLFIKPLLIFFTLPLNILTLGLFTFVVNAVLLQLASSLVTGFRIDSFVTAVIASVVISLVSAIIFKLV